jgi:hypothetical protein
MPNETAATSDAATIVGPWLEMDAKTERFVGRSILVAEANELARGSYRAPFVVPEEV